MSSKLFIVIFFISIVQTFSQSADMLLDINEGNESSFNFGTDIPTFEFKDRLYFVARSAETGLEIWVYDGNTTSLFKDINPGNEDSEPDFFFSLNEDKFIFAADDGIHGYELWTSDGTSEGTLLMTDLLPGSDDGVSKCCNSYATRSYHVFKNELYFNRNIEGFKQRFYKTDGTPEGTIELAELNGSQRSARGYLEWKDELYFEVKFEGFWKTDGTPEGTIQIKEYVDDTQSEKFDPAYLTNMGDYILLTHGYDQHIWKSDGTEEGTELVKEMFYSQAQNNVGHYFFKWEDEAFFPGSNPGFNTEMWKTNGTEQGTVQVSEIEINPGTFAYYPKQRVLFKNKIYYLGGKNELGTQIYYTDGTESGTQIMIDLKEEINGEVYFQSDLVATDDFIFFVAGRAFNRELWYSDGSAEGTFEIAIADSGDSTPERLTKYKNELFFFAKTSDFGYEPHVVDISNLISDVSNLSVNNLILSPNPAHNYINIDLEESLKYIQIYNNAGQLEATYEGVFHLDISSLNSGMKIIKIMDENNNIRIGRFSKI